MVRSQSLTPPSSGAEQHQAPSPRRGSVTPHPKRMVARITPKKVMFHAQTATADNEQGRAGS